MILLTERPAISTACRLRQGLIELFVVRSSVDVDLRGGKIKRCDIVLPVDVEITEVTAEQRNGLLWISLPLKNP